MHGLTDKEQGFIQEYTKTGNTYASYVKAYPDDKYPEKNAYELLKRPKVKAAIQEIGTQFDNKTLSAANLLAKAANRADKWADDDDIEMQHRTTSNSQLIQAARVLTPLSVEISIDKDVLDCVGDVLTRSKEFIQSLVDNFEDDDADNE